jgi:hypothetical protein
MHEIERRGRQNQEGKIREKRGKVSVSSVSGDGSAPSREALRNETLTQHSDDGVARGDVHAVAPSTLRNGRATPNVFGGLKIA